MSATKYFIEHVETRLWWYSLPNYEKPVLHPTFNGGQLRNGYEWKDCWTDDPNTCFAFMTYEDAKSYIDTRNNEYRPLEKVQITEHEFINP